LTAYFNVTTTPFEVTVSANPPEYGEVSGGGFYTIGSPVTVTAAPHTGFLFLNWIENGNIVSTEANYSFSMYGPRNLVANFVPATVEITLSKNIEEDCTLTGAGIYPYGWPAVVVYAHYNLPEYEFDNWTENGQIVSYMSSMNFKATQSRHLVANFKPATYEIPVYANPYEGGSVTGGGIYTYGTSATISATANPGYRFLNWTKYVLGNGTVVSTEPVYTYEVIGNCAFVAYFEQKDGVEILSIEPIDAGAMMLYPNPANSEMTVVLNNPALKIVEMELYDLTGKKVHQQTVNQSSGILNLNGVAQGVYILKAYLDQGEVVVWKVAKN
jgi:hypothetical protein